MNRSREFYLSAEDFARLVEAARRLAGVSLSQDKGDLVYARLVRRVRQLGLSSFSKYCELVSQPGHPETEYFVDALTTHVTSFFREEHHFQFAERDVWPALKGKTTPRVWSAGCSTGQEPYSLAISLTEALGCTSCFQVRATDISALAVETAQRGVYPREALQRVPLGLRRRYFQRGAGKQAGFHRIKPSLREHVDFAVESLMSFPTAGAPFDLIMCRNVLIYFKKEIAEQICQRFVQRLTKGGYLVLGHSEGGLKLPRVLEQVGPTCYVRTHR